MSLKIKVYNKSAEAVKDLELNAKIFAVKASNELLHQVVVSQMANARQVIADTKGRAEVSGGGKKPWKQKGTGNARAGSSRSPLWTGGGVTFGPRNTRNFSLRLNAKMRRAALIAVLTEIAKNKSMVVVKDLTLTEVSTKKFVAVLEKLPVENGKILIITEKSNRELELSSANLSFVKVLRAENINIVDLLKHKYILITEDALTKVSETLGK